MPSRCGVMRDAKGFVRTQGTPWIRHWHRWASLNIRIARHASVLALSCFSSRMHGRKFGFGVQLRNGMHMYPIARCFFDAICVQGDKGQRFHIVRARNATYITSEWWAALNRQFDETLPQEMTRVRNTEIRCQKSGPRDPHHTPDKCTKLANG